MLIQEIIRRKRSGHLLDPEEIDYIVRGIRDWSISDGQIAAFTMAVCVRGMSAEELLAFVQALSRSGTVVDWAEAGVDRPILDLHSVGGVGEKTSLILPPLVAACGGAVAMIAGRTLHHTGGTLDKLDSISGYDTQSGLNRFVDAVRRNGCAITGQSPELVPVTRRLNAIADVSATADSVAMLVSSILSRAFAAGIEGLVVNIPMGNGAFMKDLTAARTLGSALVETASDSDLSTMSVITDMSETLGHSAGNSVEVLEAIDYLTGKKRDPRLHKAVMALSAALLMQGDLAENREAAYQKLESALNSGEAAETFARMVGIMGGPGQILNAPDRHLRKAAVIKPVPAPRTGYLRAMDAHRVGLTVVRLGGGRTFPGQRIHHGVGFSELLNVGAEITGDTPVCFVHAADDDTAEAAIREIQAACTIAETPPPTTPVVYEDIVGE